MKSFARRAWLWAAVGVAAILLIAALARCITSPPLRRSEASIQQWLEKTTPLGSSLTDVRETAKRHGWHPSSDGPSIRGELGDYQGFPFVTSVTAFWEFDASNRLSNIRIWKTTDGL
jgi:hypothetical protein